MLWAIISVLFVIWLVSTLMAYTAGGLIHLLLLVAVVMAVIQLFRGRSSNT